MLAAYSRSRDVFHPLVFILPMFIFIYGYMPLSFVGSGELFSYLSEEQFLFGQALALAVLLAFVLGCFRGAGVPVQQTRAGAAYSRQVLYRGAMVMGGVGLLAWLLMLMNSGGLAGAFGTAYGMVWSDSGYVRDSAYLLLAALLILMAPQVCSPRSLWWWVTMVTFVTPWLIQAFAGARRGPTFVVAVMIGVSAYLSRARRPPASAVLLAGSAVGFLMLFLVANRSSIYIGSDLEVSTDKISDVVSASPSNEYVFGTACIISARQLDRYFWGRRLLAEVFVRPVPRQWWPNKYADVGLPELEQNAGVAGGGLEDVIGWKEVPGAAAAMVADLWVEGSWLAIPFAALWGWVYGYCWRRAVASGAGWITQYVILLMLSVYLVTQGLEAVMFRLIILSLPTQWLWRRAAFTEVPPIPTMALVHR